MALSPPSHPQRIVCLTAETAEVLWRLGAWERVVGVSGYTTRPPEARQKPRIGGFTSINIEKVLALKPDLVLSFSDLQADIVKELIHRGCNVLALNQRSLSEMFSAILLLGGVIGKEAEAAALVQELQQEMEAVAAQAARFPYRPRVFFEEWPDPLIAGIQWVSEIVSLAGGEDIFPELRDQPSAKNRILDPDAVRARDPQVVLASWCGKKVQMRRILERPGWDNVEAIRNGQVYEVPSGVILQPGPVLVEGLQQIHHVLAEVVGASPSS